MLGYHYFFVLWEICVSISSRLGQPCAHFAETETAVRSNPHKHETTRAVIEYVAMGMEMEAGDGDGDTMRT